MEDKDKIIQRYMNQLAQVTHELVKAQVIIEGLQARVEAPLVEGE